MELNKENMSEILSDDKLVVIDFWAEWCGPCKSLSPIIDELSEELKDLVTIVKCDVEENDDLTTRFAIRNVPTLIFLKNNEVVAKLTGAQTKSTITSKVIEVSAA